MKVFEDEFTLAFMDIAGDIDGHILVIPKEHCKNILDCSHDLLSRTMHTVKAVSNHLVDNCGYDGVDILNANDESAGQTVPHFHIHIIPRRKNDGYGGAGEWPHFKGANHEIETMHQLLRMKLPE